jgi:argininosuccinate lyase
MELRRSEVIDDSGFAAVARALDAVRQPPPHHPGGIRAELAVLDQRIDAMIPQSLSGAATLGLSREEWLATGARMLWRGTALNAIGGLIDVADAALALADVHAVTVMPAFLGGRPAQPTTLAHYLGGLIGPLRANRERLVGGFTRLNRSPLGSGILAGDVLAADRQDLADRLGFDGIVANTFDALASVEDVTELLDAIASAASVLRRFVREIALWVRTDPTSFVLDEGWTMLPEPGQPTLVLSERLDALEALLGEVISGAGTMTVRLREVTFGPLGSAYAWSYAGQERLDPLLESALGESMEFLRNGLIVNRAYLGNRAGRGYTTAGDLATFLMTEEQIAPSSARSIAVLVLARVREANLEVSGITQDMIDSAAMMIIGQEIKVEMESLGRFLAPRRFLERRQVTGSPAPAMAREWLADERESLDAHRRWVSARCDRIDERLEAVSDAIAEAASDTAD